MSAKFIWMTKTAFPTLTLKKHKLKWGKPFKWQWGVACEIQDYNWYPVIFEFESRREARNYRKDAKMMRGIRNATLKRRLVQVGWDDYSDTFSYNAKGNGNGY